MEVFPGNCSTSGCFRLCQAFCWLPKLLRPTYAYRKWVTGAFKDIYSLKGAEGLKDFQAKLIDAIPRLIRRHRKGLKHPEEKERFVSLLLEHSHSIATEDMRLPVSRLRSFNDITVEVEIVKAFLEALADSKVGPKVKASELADSLLELQPASRALLVTVGYLELANGRIEQAIQAARKALGISSACSAAQRLLRRAWTEKSKQNVSTVCTEMGLSDLSDRFCARPFTYLSTTPSGHTWLCDCGGWLPYSAGDLFQSESAEAVWNSDAAIEIRRSIIDGDFSYCNRTLCPSLIQGTLPRKSEIRDPNLREYIQNRTTRMPQPPTFVQLSHDETCNLACPSCRRNLVVADAAKQELLNAGRDRIVFPLLRQMKGMVLITGWGDPFASKHYRSILAALNREEFPGLQLEIVTNGLLLTPQEWKNLGRVHAMINRVKVSVDAATEESYAKIRPPGRWSQLMANLEFLGAVRRRRELKEFWINFVVQKTNFREMLEFVKLGQRLGVDRVFFQKLWNIGSLDPEVFAEMDVASPSHPLHPELLEILQHPLMKHPIVLASNLQLVFNEAAVKMER